MVKRSGTAAAAPTPSAAAIKPPAAAPSTGTQVAEPAPAPTIAAPSPAPASPSSPALEPVPPALVHSTVNSLEQFIVETRKITSTNGVLWFRGLSDETHKLVPSLYRKVGALTEEELRKREEQLNRRFRDRSMPHAQQGRDESSDVSYLQSWWRLFTMQHYGTPTRLLDWSENALLALCFAVFTASEEPKQHAVVWCLDPGAWNNIGSQNHRHPFSVDEHAVNPYSPLPSTHQHIASLWPLAIYGMHNSPRIATQQGTFVVFAPGKTKSMEAHAVDEQPKGFAALKAVKIEKNAIQDIHKDLRRLGFAHSSLYPDLQGLASELRKQFGY